MKVGLIGRGSIARYVMQQLGSHGHHVGAVLLRQEKDAAHRDDQAVTSVAELPDDLDLMIDCAGHAALTEYGPSVLERGMDLLTVSLGALADDRLYQALWDAAKGGQARLHLTSGAIGALDCLHAAQVGHLAEVTYVGRKPPRSWKGSPAEDQIDLEALTQGARTHFEGSARHAALAYPKNANVAAAVALAGIGFDATQVRLIADADLAANVHEVEARGDFGSFQFQMRGSTLPDNPRSSALAAMSVVSKLERLSQPIAF